MQIVRNQLEKGSAHDYFINAPLLLLLLSLLVAIIATKIHETPYLHYLVDRGEPPPKHIEKYFSVNIGAHLLENTRHSLVLKD